MAYIKQKNSDCIVCNEDRSPIEGNPSELSDHPAVLSGFHEVIDSELPQEIKNKLIFVVPE